MNLSQSFSFCGLQRKKGRQKERKAPWVIYVSGLCNADSEAPNRRLTVSLGGNKEQQLHLCCVENTHKNKHVQAIICSGSMISNISHLE